MDDIVASERLTLLCAFRLYTLQRMHTMPRPLNLRRRTCQLFHPRSKKYGGPDFSGVACPVPNARASSIPTRRANRQETFRVPEPGLNLRPAVLTRRTPLPKLGDTPHTP